MKTMFKRLVAMTLALCMMISIAPNVYARTASVKPGEVMGYISVGDSTFVASEIPVYTKESIDSLLDMYEDFGMKRIYWRGLQNELWNQTQHVLQESVRGAYHSEGVRKQFLEFQNADWNIEHLTIDEYFVAEAHKRNIAVYGVSTLSDWGSGGDIPINSWPAGHNALVREENSDWVPKDKYGLVEQGGALEYSIADVRDWFVQIHTAEIERVGYDGVLFITYSENYSLNYNDQFGFSEEAVSEFYSRYGLVAGKEDFTKWASIYDWQRLRGEYLTDLLRELKAALNADGEKEDICLFLDPRDPWHMQVWNSNETISDGIYLDLWTYVDEGIVDQFVINGASTLDAQYTTAENMLQLCSGTGTTVAINTSNANATQWNALKEQGVDILTYGSYEAMLYNRSEIAGKETDDSDLQLRLWLAQVAEGKTTKNLDGTGPVTLTDLTKYLDEAHYDVTVRRMALHSIMTVKPDGASDVVEHVLLNDSQSGVRAMAAHVLRYVGDSGSVSALIDAIYKYDEFAMVEAAAVALYSNGNASSWASTLRTKLTEYAANDFASKNEDNLRVCANLLRALNYVGGAADLETYKNMVNKFGPNNNTEVLLDYDLTEVQSTQADLDGVLSKMNAIVQEMWYDSIRYYAAAGIGNINTVAAFEELYSLAAGTDTVTSTPALIALGTRATSSLMTGTYRTRALEVLEEVFSATGDGSTRTDKDWVYRPIGQALQKYGNDGEAILEQYLNGSDPILALFAWRDLYIPWTPGSYNVMTTSEYEEAYLNVPDSLKEYSTVKLDQNWENKNIYDKSVPTSANGYVGDATTSAGRWGAFNQGGVEVSDFVREGSTGTQSVKMVRGSGTGWSMSGTFNALTDGQSYQMSLWLYRSNGATLTITSRNAAGDVEIGALIGDQGKLTFWDSAAGKYSTDSGLVVPEDEWIKLSMTASRLNGEITVSMTTQDGVVDTAEHAISFQSASKVDRIAIAMSTVEGGIAYLDDISVVEAVAVCPERSTGASLKLESQTVRYDGSAHELTATVRLMGSTVPTITYRDAYDESSAATTQAPTDAGTYAVTATAEYHNQTYTAEAVLTIVPAKPTVDTGKISASDITYGQKLSESVLTMEAGALTGVGGAALAGNIAWDNADQFLLKTGKYTYTIVPDNKNYTAVSGVAKVNLTGETGTTEQKVTKLEQNFEELSFTANGTSMVAGAANQIGGRWFRYASTMDDSTLLSAVGDNNLALELYRDNTDNKYVAVNLTDGITSGAAFTLSFDYYSAAQGDMTVVLDGTQYLFRMVAGGNIRLFYNGTFSSNVEMVAPTEEWVNFQVDVDTDGSFTITMTKADGTVTVSTNQGSIAASTTAKEIKFNNNSKVGVTGYIDNVKLIETTLVEKEAVYQYTEMMSQDFDDTSIFALDKANGSGYIYPANLGGTTLDGSSFNVNGDIVTIITEDDGNQCFRIRRLTGETGYQLNANSATSVGTEDCYQWSLDVKTDTGAFFTMGLGQGSFSNNEVSFIVGPDYIQSVEDTSKKLTFTQGEWVTINVFVNRENGTYTFSIGSASATVTTDKVGTLDVGRLSIWGRAAQENNNIYLDNLIFTKAEVVDDYSIVDVTISNTTQTYDGTAKYVSVDAGAAKTYTVYYNGSETAPVAAGIYQVTVLVTDTGYRGTALGTLTIEQAVPAYTGEAKNYVEVAKDSQLSQIELGITFAVPGTLEWSEDTSALSVSGDYCWTFMPEDSNNYKSVSGSIYVNVQGGMDATVKSGETTYTSLQMAVDQAETDGTATLLSSISGSGVSISRSMNIDLANMVYRITDGSVSIGDNCIVTLKNGTLSGKIDILLEHGAKLVLNSTAFNAIGTAAITLKANSTVDLTAVSNPGGICIYASGEGETVSLADGWVLTDADGNPATTLTAGATYTVSQETASTYAAGITTTTSEVSVGDTMYVNVTVASTVYDKFAASEIKLLYDETKLSFDSEHSDLNGASADANGGTLTLEDHGEEQSMGIGYKLAFTAIAKGDTALTLSYAAFGDKAAAESSDLIPANISTASVLVTAGQFHSVTLPNMFRGNASVADGEDYHFNLADDSKYYDYGTVTATMGGQPTAVVDNGDGSYTVKNVTGALIITGTRTGKTYHVTVDGTAKDDVNLPTANPQYGVDYTFNLPAIATYNVTLTGIAYDANGVAVPCTVTENTVKILGTDITGDFTITVDKTAIPATDATVTVDGNAFSDVSAPTTVVAGSDLVFTVTADGKYDYSVTATVNGSAVDVIPGENGTYTIRASSFKAGDTIVLQVTKSVKTDHVEVSPYITLDGKQMWLVTVNTEKLSDSVFVYRENKMYWSEQYNAYCYLMISAEAAPSVSADDLAIIQGTADAVNYGMDVNMSDKVDANDAQLVYNMYQAEYADFTENVTVEKFLRADINGDKTVNMNDATAIIRAILKTN